MDKPLNPWEPMTNPLDIALFGKASEETGELSSALARCMIQGIHEAEPVTGKVNYEWLQEEMADVYALLELLEDRLGFERADLEGRIYTKKKHLRGWFRMIAEKFVK